MTWVTLRTQSGGGEYLMDRKSEGADRVRQLLIQRLESLQRAGVLDLPKREVIIEPVPLSAAADQSLRQPNDRDVEKSAYSSHHLNESRDVVSARAKPNATDEIKPMAPAVRESKQHTTVDERGSALAAMQIEVAACRRCEHLACTRTQTVFGVGNQRPRLCFMGEAPGADEDRRGEPFVGRAGQLLTDIIVKGMQLQRTDVYILNVLKCRPPDNRTPTDEEIANCREYFERQLELLQPEFICCLGATAVRALLDTKQALGRMRGQWFRYGNARVMITYHPSYLLRNPPAKKDTWEDIQMLMREMGLPIGKMG